MELNQKIQAEAHDLMKSQGFKQVIVNDKGEFFTNMDLALLSVDRDKEKVMVIKSDKNDQIFKYEKKKKALKNCNAKLEEFKALSTEGMTEEQISNNVAVQTKLENRIDALKEEIKDLSKQINAR